MIPVGINSVGSSFGETTTQHISFEDFSKNISRTVEMVEPIYYMKDGNSYQADRHSVKLPILTEMRFELGVSSEEMDERVEIILCGNRVSIKWKEGFEGYKVLEEARAAKRAKEAAEMDDLLWGFSAKKVEQPSSQQSFTVQAKLLPGGIRINIMGNVESSKSKTVTIEKTENPNEWRHKKTRLTILEDGTVTVKNKKQKFTFKNSHGYVGLGRSCVKISELFEHMAYKKP